MEHKATTDRSKAADSLFNGPVGPYADDLRLLTQYDMRPFSAELRVKTFVGVAVIKSDTHAGDAPTIKLWVECWPAQFWTAEIYSPESRKTTRICTGSGSLLKYWSTFLAIAEGMLVVEHVEQHAAAPVAVSTVPKTRQTISKRDVAVLGVRQYEFTHGHKPGGFGSWAFKIGGHDELFWANQATYSDAKRKAIAEAVRLGSMSVEVQT